MSDSVWPHRRKPIRLHHLWDSPGKNTGVGCHFLLQCMKTKSENEVAQSCPTPSDPMDRSLPGSSVHGIFQARVLEWGVIAFSDSIGLLVTMKSLSYFKNNSFWTVVLEKTLESPLDCKEIKPVNPKGNQPWIFIGRTDAEAEAPILWWLDAKRWLIGKDPDAGKDWGQEEKRATEDEIVEWHHWLSGHEFEQTQGDRWRTDKPDVPQSMELQRVAHDWVTEQQKQ